MSYLHFFLFLKKVIATRYLFAFTAVSEWAYCVCNNKRCHHNILDNVISSWTTILILHGDVQESQRVEICRRPRFLTFEVMLLKHTMIINLCWPVAWFLLASLNLCQISFGNTRNILRCTNVVGCQQISGSLAHSLVSLYINKQLFL